MDYPVLAGDSLQTPPALKQWFVGDLPIATDSGTVATGQTIAQLQAIAILADGTITLFVAGTHTINQFAISAVASAAGKKCPYYTAGHFNHAAITWPSGTALDTLDERRAFLTGSTIKVGHVNP